jgi:hypothetical protein
MLILKMTQHHFTSLKIILKNIGIYLLTIKQFGCFLSQNKINYFSAKSNVLKLTINNTCMEKICYSLILVINNSIFLKALTKTDYKLGYGNNNKNPRQVVNIIKKD